MKENYIVNIITTQYMDGETTKLKMTSLATFAGQKDDYYISYSDEYDEFKDCQTTLHVENGNCVTVNRQGSYDAHMIIEKNVRHISHHSTPFGSMSFGVSAMEVESNINSEGGKLRFKYETDIDMRPLGKVEFDISLSRRTE